MIGEQQARLDEQQARLDEQAAELAKLSPGPARTPEPATDGRAGRPRATRRDVLRLAGASVVGAAVASAALQPAAAVANSGDPLLAGRPADADTPTTLLYDGPPLASGGAFVAGVGTGSPPNPAATAGVVGFAANSSALFGVHGTSTNAAGGGVLGSTPGTGPGVVGQSAGGPDLVAGGSGFLRLASAGHSIPSITPQAGDLFRMDDDQLFYATATGPPVQLINLIGTVGGLVLLDAPVRAVDTRLPGAGNGKLQPGTVRPFSLQSTTTGGNAVPEGSRAALVTLTVDATEGSGGFLTLYAADQPRPFISSINWFGPGQILANTTHTRVVRPTGGVNLFTGVNRAHAIIDVIGYYR